MKRKDFSKLKIEVQNSKDKHFEYEDYIAGAPPFLRGIHTTMYIQTPFKTTNLNNTPISENNFSEIELANFLTESFNTIKNSLQENISIDKAVSKIYFQTIIDKNQFDEIAKFRAARLLWAKMINGFNPKKQESLALKIASVINTSEHALSAILGGCQSLASNETTHLFFEEETGILNTIDPWAGSTYLEKRTEEITNKAWAIFKKENKLN